MNIYYKLNQFHAFQCDKKKKKIYYIIYFLFNFFSLEFFITKYQIIFIILILENYLKPENLN
jgi:hypothetical protein